MEDTETADVPLFLTLTLCPALAVPRLWLPKFRLAGLAVSVGPPLIGGELSVPSALVSTALLNCVCRLLEVALSTWKPAGCDAGGVPKQPPPVCVPTCVELSTLPVTVQLVTPLT